MSAHSSISRYGIWCVTGVCGHRFWLQAWLRYSITYHTCQPKKWHTLRFLRRVVRSHAILQSRPVISELLWIESLCNFCQEIMYNGLSLFPFENLWPTVSHNSLQLCPSVKIWKLWSKTGDFENYEKCFLALQRFRYFWPILHFSDQDKSTIQ